MRYSSYLSSLAVILAASVAAFSTHSTLPPPHFTALFTGKANQTYHASTEGPFGERYHYEAGNGDMLNAVTGEKVANILSISYDGIATDAGLAFNSGTMALIWSADGHFAWVSINAIATRASNISWAYGHVETDSPTYSWMNGKFLILQGDSSVSPALSFTIYEETSSSAPGSS